MPVPLAGLAGGLALVDQLVWLFTPINRLVDEFHDSKEERAARRAEVTALQNEALALTLSLERERLMAQAAIVSAEAGGASWLQRNWRPITMLSFLGLVIADAFGMLAFRLADQAWLLLQIGLGGYVVGRSVEKISPQITNGNGNGTGNGTSNANGGLNGGLNGDQTKGDISHTPPRTRPKSPARSPARSSVKSSAKSSARSAARQTPKRHAAKR